MNTNPRGSYAALNATGMRDERAGHSGHDLDGWHADRTVSPVLAIMIAAAVFAVIAGYVLWRGGPVDRTHYTQPAVEVER